MILNEVLFLLQEQNTSITFVGDGAAANKILIEDLIPNSMFCIKNDLSSFSLGLAGYETYIKGISTSVMPLYLRKSQAERALEEKSSKKE